MDRDTELLQDDQGSVATEYVVILILVTVAGIGAWVEWREAVEADAGAHYQTFGYPT